MRVTTVGPDFTRRPVKYERFIRPMGLRYRKAHVTHPELKVTVQLPIISVKKVLPFHFFYRNPMFHSPLTRWPESAESHVHPTGSSYKRNDHRGKRFGIGDGNSRR